MKRIETEEYPLRAVREAIVNAIIHRDYQIVGSEIHVDMFDDRLEITSPGGMIDGNFVQNLDITKISSIRRNRIISDIFNRLNYMERRGSGLIRILESYNDCQMKPIFYSDVSSFKVIFPNKSLVELNNTILKETEEIGKNIVSDSDYFAVKIYKVLQGNIRKNTYEQLQKLFDKFTYKYDFKREDIEEIFNVKKSRASDIISMLLENDLIVASEPTKYRFKNKKVKTIHFHLVRY